MVGAFSYGLSSFFLTRIGHPTFVASAAWIPFFFYGFEMALEKERRGTLALVAFLSLGYLAGFPQVFLFGVTALVIYVISTSIEFALRRDGKRALACARVLGLAGVLSLLIVSVQLVPFLELVRNSIGLGITPEQTSRMFVQTPILLVRSLIPNLFGNPVEGTSWIAYIQEISHPYNLGFMVYCGAGALLMTFGGFAFIRASRHMRAFFIILALSLALGLSCTFVRVAQAIMPAIAYSQIDRVSAVACFAISVLAGMTFSLVATAQDRAKRNLRLIVLLVVIVILAASTLFLLKGDSVFNALASRARSVPSEVSLSPASVRANDWIPGDLSQWLAYERRQVAEGQEGNRRY